MLGPGAEVRGLAQAALRPKQPLAMGSGLEYARSAAHPSPSPPQSRFATSTSQPKPLPVCVILLYSAMPAQRTSFPFSSTQSSNSSPQPQPLSVGYTVRCQLSVPPSPSPPPSLQTAPPALWCCPQPAAGIGDRAIWGGWTAPEAGLRGWRIRQQLGSAVVPCRRSRGRGKESQQQGVVVGGREKSSPVPAPGCRAHAAARCHTDRIACMLQAGVYVLHAHLPAGVQLQQVAGAAELGAAAAAQLSAAVQQRIEAFLGLQTYGVNCDTIESAARAQHRGQ